MRVLLIAVAASLLLAGPAGATPRWLAPVDLSADFVNVDPEGQVAVAPDGTAVVAWQQPVSSGSNVLQVARRRPGEAFGPAKTLTPSTDNVPLPHVAIDAADNATIVWAQETPTVKDRVRATRWPAAANDPEAIQTLSNPAVASAAPALGVGPNGTAVVLFDEGVFGATTVKAAVRPGASGAFESATSISGSYQFVDDKHVAINVAGDAIALFSVNDGTGRSIVQSNERVPGGSFAATGEPRSSVAVGDSGFGGAIVLDPTGRATALWTDVRAGVTEVHYADRPPGGPWSPDVRASELAGTTESAAGPSADVAADGTVIAAWSVGTSGANVVEGAVRPSGGAFGDYRKLSAPGMDVFGTIVDVNARGDAVLAWSGNNSEAIYTVRRPAGGAFGALEPAARKEDHAPGEDLSFFAPDIALDDEDNATAVWSRGNTISPTSTLFRLQAAGFDAAPPTLAAVAVPAAGTAGSGIGMAAAATDRWSPVSLNWAFGDGTGATGGAVTHPFAKAGAFTVTVTATDAVGNATATSRPILVAAARKRRIVTSVATRWGTRGSFVYLLQMKVKRPPKGTVAELRCSGKRCPFKHKRAKKIRKGALDVHKALGRKTRFRAGQTLELRITKKGYVGKVVRYKLRKGKIPSGQQLCLPPGAKKARKRC